MYPQIGSKDYSGREYLGDEMGMDCMDGVKARELVRRRGMRR